MRPWTKTTMRAGVGNAPRAPPVERDRLAVDADRHRRAGCRLLLERVADQPVEDRRRARAPCGVCEIGAGVARGERGAVAGGHGRAVQRRRRRRGEIASCASRTGFAGGPDEREDAVGDAEVHVADAARGAAELREPAPCQLRGLARTARRRSRPRQRGRVGHRFPSLPARLPLELARERRLDLRRERLLEHGQAPSRRRWGAAPRSPRRPPASAPRRPARSAPASTAPRGTAGRTCARSTRSCAARARPPSSAAREVDAVLDGLLGGAQQRRARHLPAPVAERQQDLELLGLGERLAVGRAEALGQLLARR